MTLALPFHAVGGRGSALSWATALGYVAVMAALSAGLWQARRWAMRELGSPQAVADWQAWKRHVADVQPRSDVAVKWRVPKSDEPPLLILLRDSFPGVVAGCLTIASFLYAFFAIVVRGLLAPQPPRQGEKRLGANLG